MRVRSTLGFVIEKHLDDDASYMIRDVAGAPVSASKASGMSALGYVEQVHTLGSMR